MQEPILVAVAAALAGKAVTSLYDVVKRRFAGRDGAAQVLAAAEGADPESPEVAALACELARAEHDDPGFAAELRVEWEKYAGRQVQHGGTTNQITGSVTGKVVQARDIQGGVRF